MTEIKVTKKVHFGQGRKCRKVLREGEKKEQPAGHVQRVTRLMALAIQMQELIVQGRVKDYAEMARFNQVSRARMTQIMNLLLLAPDIQEAILSLPRVERLKDEFGEVTARSIAAIHDWHKQRKVWANINKEADTRTS